MHIVSDRRRRTPSPALPASPASPTGPAGASLAQEGWISLAGKGPGFHDCPLCRELASHPDSQGSIEAVVGVNLKSLPDLMRTGWLDDLIALVGPDATVELMGRDLESHPIEVISMAAFLTRIGYE